MQTGEARFNGEFPRELVRQVLELLPPCTVLRARAVCRCVAWFVCHSLRPRITAWFGAQLHTIVTRPRSGRPGEHTCGS